MNEWPAPRPPVAFHVHLLTRTNSPQDNDMHLVSSAQDQISNFLRSWKKKMKRKAVEWKSELDECNRDIFINFQCKLFLFVCGFTNKFVVSYQFPFVCVPDSQKLLLSLSWTILHTKDLSFQGRQIFNLEYTFSWWISDSISYLKAFFYFFYLASRLASIRSPVGGASPTGHTRSKGKRLVWKKHKEWEWLPRRPKQ